MNRSDSRELDEKIGKDIQKDFENNKKQTIDNCMMADRISQAVTPLGALCKLHLCSQGKKVAIEVLATAVNTILLDLCDTTDEALNWAKELDPEIRARIIAIDNAINKEE